MHNRFYSYFLLVLLLFSHGLYAQIAVGISSGISSSKFKDLGSEIESDYKMSPCVSVWVSKSIDTLVSLGVEAEMKTVSSAIEYGEVRGHGAYYYNVNHELEIARFYLNGEVSLVEMPLLAISFMFSPYINYVYRAYSKGYGWNDVLTNQVNDKGEPVSYTTTEEWSVDEVNLSDISTLTYGLRLGSRADYPINERLGVSVGLYYSRGMGKLIQYLDERSIDGKVGLRYNF